MLGPPVVRAGRRASSRRPKVLASLRLDADVLAYFRALGPGYQARINLALRDVIAKRQRRSGGTT